MGPTFGAGATPDVLAKLSALADEDSARRAQGISAAAANRTVGAMGQTAHDEVALGRNGGGATRQLQYGPGAAGYAGIGDMDPRAYAQHRAEMDAGTGALGLTTSSAPNGAAAAAAERSRQAAVRQVDPGLQPGAEQPHDHDGIVTMSDALPEGRPRRTGAELADYLAHYSDVTPEQNAESLAQSAGSSEKARRMAELDRAGEHAVQAIQGIGPTNAPGTKSALASDLQHRADSMLAALASPPATQGAYAPNLAEAPMPGAPGAAGAQPAQAQPMPVARFPLGVAPPNYGPPVAYPTPGQPSPGQLSDLDRAAAADYARFRMGR